MRNYKKVTSQASFSARAPSHGPAPRGRRASAASATPRACSASSRRRRRTGSSGASSAGPSTSSGARASASRPPAFFFFAIFWRARSRLYQNEFLQENMRLTAFFKLYKICILLHRCDFKIFAKNRFEQSAINFPWKFSKNFADVAKFAKFAKLQKKVNRNSE